MKKIIIAIACIISLAGCQKKYCWKCVMYKGDSNGVLDLTRSFPSTQCDMTEAEIKAFEKTNTKSVNVGTATNVVEKIYEQTNCSK